MDSYYAPKCTPHFIPPLPKFNSLGDGDISVVSFNPITSLAIVPDETIAMLQQVVDYRLTVEQKSIAKMSALELLNSALLSGRAEINVLDLVKLWKHSPELADFAKALRMNMLPS